MGGYFLLIANMGGSGTGGSSASTTYLFVNFRRASDRWLLRFLQPQS